ncbi:MAG: restriction endonuclease subunit S [Bacteroidetes bacterium]|nr:restriction endonuclease subunit S [Bacteroidota bacterium]
MSNWKSIKIRDYEEVEIILGQSPTSKSYNDNKKGMPFLQGKSEFGTIYPIPKIYTTSPLKIANSNDILISVRAPVGDVNLCPYKLCIGRGLAAIKFKKDNSKFYFYWFLHNQKLIESLGIGSTFKAITGEQLKNIKIPIVNIKEQKVICEILSTVDEAIQKADEAIKKTERIKQSMMQKLLTEGIGHKEFKETKIGKIPKDWKIFELDALFDLSSGITRPKEYSDKKGNEYQIPIFGGNGILGYTNKSNIDEPAIVIGRVGEYCGAVHFADAESWITDNALYTKKFLNPNLYHIDYLTVYLRFLQLNRFKKKSGQPLITQTIINKIKIPLPTQNEQNEIMKLYLDIDQILTLRIQRKINFVKIKLGLMDELLTGRKRVKIN